MLQSWLSRKACSESKKHLGDPVQELGTLVKAAAWKPVSKESNDAQFIIMLSTSVSYRRCRTPPPLDRLIFLFFVHLYSSALISSVTPLPFQPSPLSITVVKVKEGAG
ncbi:uncharacterized [Tachysurus ichikawai]